MTKSNKKCYYNNYQEIISFFLNTQQHCQHLFAVVSWGCCATSWLSKVLNFHPEIMCLHNFLVGFTEIDNRNAEDYMRAIYITSYPYLVAGDVHGVPRDAIPYLQEQFGSHFSAVTLVRDPYHRFFSMLSAVRWNQGMDNDYSYIDDLVDRLGIDIPLTWDNRMLIHAANMLNAIIDEKKLVGDRIYRMEDLVKNKEKLSELIQDISNNLIIPDEEWLDSAIAIKPINSHRKKLKEQILLSSQEKEVVLTVFDKKAQTIYENLGYDIEEFIKKFQL